jgi:lysine 2,3-aminomutase
MRRWQKELQNAVRDIEELRQYIHLTPEEGEDLRQVVAEFPMQIPRSYLKLIDPSDPNDPIRKLVVPEARERQVGGMLDTSGESDNVRVRGLQHKYRATALILTNNMCAAYCRYCFRKRLFCREEPQSETIHDLEPALDYIRRHEEINNVLISGGDPLVLGTEKLERLLKALRKIEHVRTIRIGSKVPAFLPTRITSDSELVEVLSRHSRPERRLYLVTHFDHPRELTKEALRAITKLARAGVALVNQAVLVRGINDNPVTLRELFNRLSDAGVAPYYIFQCRPVKGSLRLQVPLARGYSIVESAKRGCGGLGKRLRYIMSHYSGKIEVVGVLEEKGERRVYLKYHQARDPRDVGRFFWRPLPADACWLDQLPEAETEAEVLRV